MPISISIAQTFRSWEVIFHLHPPMAFLFPSLCDMSVFAPHTDVLFWGQLRLSNKLLEQGYAKVRLRSLLRKFYGQSSLKKFYGRYGDLIKQYEVPLSRMLNDIPKPDHIQWHPPFYSYFTPNHDLITELDLLPNYKRFP